MAFSSLSLAHTQPWHACGLLDSQEYVGALQSPFGQLIPQTFLPSFQVSLLLALNVICHLRQQRLKYLPVNISSIGPRQQLSSGPASSQAKKPVYQKVTRLVKTNNYNSLSVRCVLLPGMGTFIFSGTANIKLKGERLKTFSLRSVIRKDVHFRCFY